MNNMVWLIYNDSNHDSYYDPYHDSYHDAYHDSYYDSYNDYSILLPIDFGQLPLQTHRIELHDLKLMSHDLFDRGGMELNPDQKSESSAYHPRIGAPTQTLKIA